MATLQDWKDEVTYCIDLLHSRGNRSVPRSSVKSYLDTQAADARRDCLSLLARGFTESAHAVAADKWDAAVCILEVFDDVELT